MIDLLCTGRGCREPLERTDKTFACPRGHAFDVARSGYLNLLQPHDRRSRSPGDSREAAESRRRALEAGYGDAIVRELAGIVAALPLPDRPAVLDVGCGEGSYLAEIARRRPVDGV